MTLFEKIVAREVPAEIVHEDALCIAFHDISPQAPIHVLIVPKIPIPRIAAANQEDQTTLGHLLLTAAQVASDLGVDTPDGGFRIVINNGPHGGETVPHLHVHLLGGRALSWPPG